MGDITLNYAAILVAAIANMVLGSLWYSPFLFGNIWMKGMGLNKANVKTDKYMTARYATAFFTGLLTVFILAHYVSAFHLSTMNEGLQAAFWPWLGFMLPLHIGDVLWGSKPWSVFLVNASHYLVAMLIAGVILVSWQ